MFLNARRDNEDRILICGVVHPCKGRCNQSGSRKNLQGRCLRAEEGTAGGGGELLGGSRCLKFTWLPWSCDAVQGRVLAVHLHRPHFLPCTRMLASDKKSALDG